jgi:hypothetical protein
MAWHNRLKQSVDGTRVKEYWQATDAVSRPLAILLTLVVLFICAALIFSLFLGGRWLFRRIDNDSDNIPAVVQVEETPTQTNNALGDIDLGATPIPSPTPTPTPTISNPVSNIPNTGPEPE